jgi:hypothetical protein
MLAHKQKPGPPSLNYTLYGNLQEDRMVIPWEPLFFVATYRFTAIFVGFYVSTSWALFLYVFDFEFGTNLIYGHIMPYP